MHVYFGTNRQLDSTREKLCTIHSDQRVLANASFSWRRSRSRDGDTTFAGNWGEYTQICPLQCSTDAHSNGELTSLSVCDGPRRPQEKPFACCLAALTFALTYQRELFLKAFACCLAALTLFFRSTPFSAAISRPASSHNRHPRSKPYTS